MTERVAVAELRTMAYRALVAEGASSGEAEAAAVACAISEVEGAGGLALIVAAAGRVPRERIGARVNAGTPARLVDPAARAAVLQTRIALDWLGAHPDEAIALPGVTDAPSLIGALPRGTTAVGFVDGAAVGGCAITNDGNAVRFDDDGGIDVPAVDDGIVLIAAAPRSGEVTPAAVREVRWAEACAQGVIVERATWHALLGIADRYLVPEA